MFDSYQTVGSQINTAVAVAKDFSIDTGFVIAGVAVVVLVVAVVVGFVSADLSPSVCFPPSSSCGFVVVVGIVVGVVVLGGVVDAVVVPQV